MEPNRIPEELARVEAYPHAERRPETVRWLQTHASWLFFAGDRVYKVKKPVDLGFLDFRDPEVRRSMCAEEVRLNERLAPGVYRGVVPIVEGPDGRLEVGQGGEDRARAVAWAVEMLRLPATRMLDHLLELGEVDNDTMNRVARRLADFHAAAETGPGVDEHGTPEAVRALVEENLEQLAPFTAPPGDASDDPPVPGEGQVLSAMQLAFLRERAHGFLVDHARLLGERVRAGRIREGHGDLHAGNLCYADARIVAYDCLEFRRDFRCADVTADVAFLAMDLDVRGFPAFGSYLMKRYAELAGDPGVRTLEGFYKGYRALVRAKVSALQAVGLRSVAAERLLDEGRRYVQLAASYELPPALVLMCGLPASGKSWVARQLAPGLRAAVLHSDVHRKTMRGLDPHASARSAYGTGLYTRAAKQAVYDALLELTRQRLGGGQTVVVDATFARADHRRRFFEVADSAGLPAFVVHVTATEEQSRERLAEREEERRRGSTASDADVEVWRRAQDDFEAPAEVPAEALVRWTSGGSVAQASRLLDRRIARM